MRHITASHPHTVVDQPMCDLLHALGSMCEARVWSFSQGGKPCLSEVRCSGARDTHRCRTNFAWAGWLGHPRGLAGWRFAAFATLR